MTTSLKQKIKDTYLLDPSEKIDLLIQIDSMSNEQRAEVEKTIDDYDAQARNIMGTFKKDILKSISDFEKKSSNRQNIIQATKKIRQGLNVIVPD